MPVYDCYVIGRDNANRAIQQKFDVLRFGVQCKDGVTPKVVGLADQQTHRIKAWISSYSVHSAPSKEDGAWQVYENFLIHDGPDNPSESYATIGCVEIMGALGFTRFNNLLISLSGTKAKHRAQQLAEVGRGEVWITKCGLLIPKPFVRH